MNVCIMLTLFHNNAVAHLLAAILLSASVSISSGMWTENADIRELWKELTTAGMLNISTKNADILVDTNTTRPEVEMPQGRVRGVNMVTHHGRRIFGFNGIPYALPPVGNLRFKGPQPPKAWNGTLDANNDAVYCPQMNENVFIGNEDCLYLHVYTPRLPTHGNSTLLPVMVFIFGGQFKAGHPNPSRWGPDYLLDKDVVLVVPSYRLGVLGFLSTGDEVAPGNNGLKDIVQALKWNRDNIKYFGGDPSRVTLFGSSSGAISVHLLTLSNSKNGLFQRYITNSGSALSTISQVSKEVIRDYSTRLGNHLGCPTNASEALVNCLVGLNASQLVDTVSVFFEWDTFPQIVWRPTIEPEMEGAVITESAMDLISSGRIRDLPWLSSLDRDEGIVFGAFFYLRPDVFEEFLNKIDAVLPHILEYHGFVDDVPACTAALKSYYLNDLTADRNLLLRNFTQLIGDALFTYPGYSAIQKHFVHAKNPQYFCSFEYQGTFSQTFKFSGGSTENYGVSHADDLIYLYWDSVYPLGPPGSEMSENDWSMVDTMVQLWTSFVIDGKPSTKNLNTTISWEPYSSRNNYFRIGNSSDPSLGVGYNYFENRMGFWDELVAAGMWK